MSKVEYTRFGFLVARLYECVAWSCGMGVHVDLSLIEMKSAQMCVTPVRLDQMMFINIFFLFHYLREKLSKHAKEKFTESDMEEGEYSKRS